MAEGEQEQGKDQGQPQKSGGAVERLLLRVATADSELLPTRVERTRMAVLGVFVLVIAGMGGLSLCLYLTMINGLFHWWYLGAAAGWAFIVLTVDRSILAEPSYGDLRPVERRADHIASLGDQSLWPPSLAAEP